jgi:hypothetical protein
LKGQHRAVGLVLLASFMASVTTQWTAVVMAAAPCSNPLEAQLCEELNHGQIVLGSARRESEQRHDADSGTIKNTDVDGKALALNAFCADARSNAAAGGTALPPEVAALCAPGPGAMPLSLS